MMKGASASGRGDPSDRNRFIISQEGVYDRPGVLLF
mgnify:CR=1 FL=1